MLWIKRLLPLIIIGFGWIGYTYLDYYLSAKRQAEEGQLALVTAQIWIATAKFRDEPTRYLAYRDSLLEVTGVPREKIFAFLESRENQPEELLPFTQKIHRLVDSLYRVEDSLYREARIRAHDSAQTTGSDLH